MNSIPVCGSWSMNSPRFFHAHEEAPWTEQFRVRSSPSVIVMFSWSGPITSGGLSRDSMQKTII